MVAQRCHPGDAGLQAPASCCTETQAHREGLILPGAHRRAASASWTSAAPSPSGGVVAPPHHRAWQGAPLSHPSPMSPGALVPAVPHSTGVCRPHLAPPQELWMGAGTQPLCCHEAFSGFPCAGCDARRSWASSELSRGSCPGASSIPPAACRALDPLRARGPVLQRGSWCCSGGPGAAEGIPVLQHPRASAWLQPGGAASPVPRVCLELSPRQPSVALSSINLILPVLHSCFFFFF